MTVPLESEAPYTCPSCFETNYLAIDPGGGRKQRFTEDCPVCCRPILFTTQRDDDGESVVLSAEPES
jgi:hypothetical protein